MLYDPKWEVETKPDPMKLDTLIAWLRTQTPSKQYDYDCNGSCLLSQYFIAAGLRGVHMFTDCFYHGNKKWPHGRPDDPEAEGFTMLPPGFNQVAVGYPRTFGSALKRAERIASSP